MCHTRSWRGLGGGVLWKTSAHLRSTKTFPVACYVKDIYLFVTTKLVMFSCIQV